MPKHKVVTYIADQALPDGHDWALVNCRDLGVHLYIKESAVCPQVLEEAWAAYDALRLSYRKRATDAILRNLSG